MTKVNVSLLHGTAYIFNADGKENLQKKKKKNCSIIDRINHSCFYVIQISDYMKIRKQYRIVGNLIGFNAQKPRNQNLKGIFFVNFP